MIDILEQYGNQLREPYSKSLDDGIFELRALDRIFREFCIFFYYEGRIILTNGFVKKIQKIPQNEIALSKKYRRDFLEGNDR